MGRGWRRFAVTLIVVVGLLLLALPALLDGSEPRPSGAVPAITDEPVGRIAIAGDIGTRDENVRATADQMVDQSRRRPYDALVLLGDLVYDEGDADLARASVLRPFDDVLDQGAVLVPALGNHDIESGEQGLILQQLGRRSAWYEERVGSVRILVLDSNRPDLRAQTDWLRARLAEPQPDDTWTIAAMHHPPYSAGEHGSSLDVRDAWAPLFVQARVPLVLAGHDHDYQRSKPQEGVTYVVSGGGAKLRDTGREDFTAVSASILHYVDLLVYPDRLVGRAIDQDGNLIDSWTIRRPEEVAPAA